MYGVVDLLVSGLVHAAKGVYIEVLRVGGHDLFGRE